MQHPNTPNNLKPTTPGTATSGIGSALLVLFFFLPWFNACGAADISGSQLATPVLPGAPSAWWLWGIPLVGLLGVGLAASVWQKPVVIVKQRAKFMFIVPIYPLGCILLLYIVFQTSSDPLDPRQVLEFRYGFFGTILATLAIFIGAVMDMVVKSSFADISLPNHPIRAPSLPLSAHPSLPPPRHPPSMDMPRRATGPPVEPPTLRPQQRQLSPPPQRGHSTTAWLVGGRGKRTPIEFDQFTIGRHPDNNLTISDSTISRQHAVIRQAKGRYFIQDKSWHGLYLNDKEIEASELQDGDVIGLGDVDFEFIIGT